MHGCLSPAAFGRAVGLSRKTIYHWITLRKLTVYRVGGRTWIPEHEINRLKREGCRPAVKLWRGAA